MMAFDLQKYKFVILLLPLTLSLCAIDSTRGSKRPSIFDRENEIAQEKAREDTRLKFLNDFLRGERSALRDAMGQITDEQKNGKGHVHKERASSSMNQNSIGNTDSKSNKGNDDGYVAWIEFEEDDLSDSKEVYHNSKFQLLRDILNEIVNNTSAKISSLQDKVNTYQVLFWFAVVFLILSVLLVVYIFIRMRQMLYWVIAIVNLVIWLVWLILVANRYWTYYNRLSTVYNMISD